MHTTEDGFQAFLEYNRACNGRDKFKLRKHCRPNFDSELSFLFNPLVQTILSIYLPIMSNPCWGPRHMYV